MRTLLALLALAWAAAGEVHIAEADPLLRPGLLFRCTVIYAGPDVGPCTLSAALLQGDRVLSRLDLPLDRSSRLGGSGARIALPPPVAVSGTGPAPRLAITITGAGAAGAAERAVGTVDGARAAIDGHYAWLLASGEQDPLPWLWIEQGAALATGPITLGNLRGLDAANAAITSWRAGVRPTLRAGANLRALRDPVDGSVQPFRLHLPSRAAGAPLALLLANAARTPGKERWPDAADGLITAITAAGIAVVEAYPAGDIAWNGVAPRRALLALDAALRLRDPGFDGARPLLVGTGSGAAGAMALAEDDPGRWGALLLADPRGPTGERPGNLATMAVALTGLVAPTMHPWLDGLHTAGGASNRSLPGSADGATWQWLLAARATPLPITVPRSLVRTTPGPAGPLLIDELSTWGQPAEVRWQGDPLRITTSGVARLRLINPAAGVLINGQPYRAPAGAAKPRKAWGQAWGPLAAYGDAPFVIVTGTGESDAAVSANATLAQGFLAAWVAHAQGAPPRVSDRAFRDRDWPDRHLVLIGNPRSNRILRDLADAGLRLPLEWDARSVRGLGHEFQRAENRSIALCWPHPANDGRLLVVLDGAPAWSAGTLPLDGLPDLIIGPAAAGGAPLLSRSFSCDWR